MLTAKNIKPEQGKAYFEKGYLGTGRWFGDGATRLNLPKELNSQQEFENLMDGYSPDRSRSLMARRVKASKHRSATDCTFNAPKSISIRALVDGDKRLIAAHLLAVESSLKVMESRYAQTRIQNKGEPRRKVKTGNLAIAQFDHIETRELDPHLHTHCVVMNHTQGDDGKWRSLHNSDIFQNLKLLGMVYQHKLAIEVEKLGYQVDLKGNGQFELVGYQQKDLDTFSQRKKQIIDKVGVNATKRDKIWAWDKTRRKKILVKPEKLEAMWNERAEQLKLQWKQSKNQQTVKRSPNLSQLVTEALDNLSSKSVYLNLEDIEKYVLERSEATSLEEIQKAIPQNKDLIRVDDKRYTTLAAIKLEIATIKLMQRERKKALSPLMSNMSERQKRESSNLDQKEVEAIALPLTSNERFTAIRTTNFDQKYRTIAAIKNIAAEIGFKLRAIASDNAAQLLQDKVGIETNSFEELQKNIRANPIGKEIWLVDESEKMTNKDAFNMMAAAVITDTRVIMMGKVRERASLSYIFKSLQQAGMPRSFLEKPAKEKNAYLEAATELVNDGQIDAGVRYLERNGSLQKVGSDKEAEELVRDYMSRTPSERNKTLILAGDSDREKIESLIKEELKKKGNKSVIIQQAKRKLLKLEEDRNPENYEKGDLIIPQRDCEKRNLKKGEVYKVLRRDSEEKDKLFVKSRKGQFLKIDLKFQKLVLSKEKLEITEGMRLRMTRTNERTGRKKGDTFTVNKIKGNYALITFDCGKKDKMNFKSTQSVEYAYFENKYPPSCRKTDNVLILGNSALKEESLLSAIARSKKDLKIYIESPEKLVELAEKSRGQLNRVELMKIREYEKIRKEGKKTAVEKVEEEQKKESKQVAPPVVKQSEKVKDFDEIAVERCLI